MADAIELPAELTDKINQAMIVRPGDMLVLVVDQEQTPKELDEMRAELRAGIGDSRIKVLVVHGARAFVAEAEALGRRFENG